MRPLVAALLAALLAGCVDERAGPSDGRVPPPPPAPPGPPPPPPSMEPGFTLRELVGGLEQPLYATHAGDGSGRLFIVEQGGRVRVWKDGALRAAPFLDLRGQVSTGNEQGLLSIAFDPDFERNGRVFVDSTDRRGDTVLARYTVDPGDPDRLDPASARTLLTVDQPYANHNGGLALFGPDGFLYVGLGDGGSGGDPHGHGQDRDSLLGKLLRLDVRGEAYASPPGNPFAGGGGRPEVWAFGLRNPWRFSFDRATGDLYVADVGQNAVEEVNFQAAGGPGGENYGWNVWEGSRRFRQGETVTEPVFPVAEYAREGGHCSVTGGYVYRGELVPALRGWYLYGDYCSGVVWGLAPRDGAWATRELKRTGLSISSFGEDEAGELYVVDHGGAVHQVAP